MDRADSDLSQVNRAMNVLALEHGYKILTGETCCRGCAFGYFEAKYGPMIPNADGGHDVVFYTEQHEADSDNMFTAPFYIYWNGDVETICLAFMLHTDFDVTVPENESQAIVLHKKSGWYSRRPTTFMEDSTNEEYDNEDCGGDDDQYDDEEDLGLEDVEDDGD